MTAKREERVWMALTAIEALTELTKKTVVKKEEKEIAAAVVLRAGNLVDMLRQDFKLDKHETVVQLAEKVGWA